MRFVLLSLAVLGAGGCAKHAVDAVGEMRARACAADAAGFFSHVDREEMIRTTEAASKNKYEASLAKLDPAAKAAARQRLHEAALTAVDDTCRIWEYDIKRGPASDLCRMEIVESSEAGDTASVRVRNPADLHWRMARHGRRWFFVGGGD
jgi:hypothetical protein